MNLLDFYSYRIIGKLTAFFEASGVQSAQSTSGGFFHFRPAAFLSGLKSKVGLALTKAAVLRIVLNLDGAPITYLNLTLTLHTRKLLVC